MKRNPHIIVQQVCPLKKTKDGECEVQVAIVRHKGIMGRFRMGYHTKRHARWAQHLICTTRNHTRLRALNELRAIIDRKEAGND